MSKRAQIALVVLMSTQGLAGCDDPSSPAAPTTVLRPVPVSTAAPTTEGYTLTPSSPAVTPGGQLSVSWTVPKGEARDWIALASVSDANCDHGWSEYTGGATSGTFTLKAPIQPGQYEFRYHLNDGCELAGRSDPVTVRPGS